MSAPAIPAARSTPLTALARRGDGDTRETTHPHPRVLRSGTAAAFERRAAAAQRSGWESGGSVVKVLLVDDSAAVRTSFGELLSDIPGVELVGCAADVASAMALIDARGPDLVVLDVELRNGQPGIELLHQVKRRGLAIPIIVLSSFGGDALRRHLRAAGAAACFDKATEFERALAWIAQRVAAQA